MTGRCGDPRYTREHGVFPGGRHEFQCVDSLGSHVYKSQVHHGIRPFARRREDDTDKIIVLAVALVGLVFMIRPWDIQEGNTVLGIVSMLLATVFFGAYTVDGKVSVQKMGIMAQTSISFILGSLILLIIILIMGKPVTAGVVENLPLVLYVGIFVTGLGYFSYFTAIKLSDATTGSFAFFLKTAIAPVMAVIFLKETILWNTYAGIGLILLASYMNINYQRKDNEIKKTFENTGH